MKPAEFVAAHPTAHTLSEGIKAGWQFYHECHKALHEYALQHLDPEQAGIVLDHVVNAMREDARSTPRNAAEVEEMLKTLMQPIIQILAAPYKQAQTDTPEIPNVSDP